MGRKRRKVASHDPDEILVVSGAFGGSDYSLPYSVFKWVGGWARRLLKE